METVLGYPITAIFILYIAQFLCIFIYKLLLTLAVGKDCKAKQNRNRVLWMIGTFILSTITAIIYAFTDYRKKPETKQVKICCNCSFENDLNNSVCNVCGANQFRPAENANENIKTPKNAGKALCIIAVIFFIASFVFAGINSGTVIKHTIGNEALLQIHHYPYGMDDEKIYFDKKGNTYADEWDVLYYDENENTYLYTIENSYAYFKNTKTGEKYPSYNCYVTTYGFLYYDSEEKIHSKINMFADDFDSQYASYTDDEGNRYYPADSVSWDDEGILIDSQYGEILNNGK